MNVTGFSVTQVLPRTEVDMVLKAAFAVEMARLAAT